MTLLFLCRTTYAVQSKQRLFCTINKNPKFQCGMMALGEGRGYITVSKKKLKDFTLALGDTIQVIPNPIIF
jgi:hypothetical protein